MNSAKTVIEKLLHVLDVEREAIRKLDGASVGRASAQKEELAAELSRASADDLRELKSELNTLRSELRRNGVLLAHARGCINEVLDMMSPSRGGPRRGTLRAQV